MTAQGPPRGGVLGLFGVHGVCVCLGSYQASARELIACIVKSGESTPNSCAGLLPHRASRPLGLSCVGLSPEGVDMPPGGSVPLHKS